MNAPAYRPTHTVPAGGLPAWSTPDSAQPLAGRLDPWLEVQVVQWWGQWANVQCSNQWMAWVDGTALQPIGAPPPPMARPAGGPAGGRVGATAAAASYALPMGLLAAALVLVGPFLPWLSVSGFDENAFHIPIDFLWSIDAAAKLDAEPVSVGGLVVLLALGIAGLAFAQQVQARRLVGALAAAVCVVYAIELMRSLNESPDAPSLSSVLGFGVYVSLVGAVVALVLGGSRAR